MDCVTDLAFMSDPACLFGKGNLFLGETMRVLQRCPPLELSNVGY